MKTLLLLMMVSTSAAFANELSERNEIAVRVANDFEQRKFADLESLAVGYRDGESRTTSGLWKLTLFYSGFQLIGQTSLSDEKGLTRNLDIAQQWIDKYPQSATPRVVYALLLYERAWAIRGASYASSVDPESWQPFADYVKRTRERLTGDEKIARADPYWYELNLKVAMCQGVGRNKFMRLLDQAVSAHPYYYQYYFVAIEYFSPKWYGNAREVSRIAEYAVNHTKKEGAGMYARAYWFAAQFQYEDKLFDASHVSWVRMKHGIRDVLSKYPDQWNINNFAYISCLAGDRRQTASLTAQISAPIPEAWKNDDQLFAQCKEWSLGAPAKSPLQTKSQ